MLILVKQLLFLTIRLCTVLQQELRIPDGSRCRILLLPIWDALARAIG